MLLIGFGNPGRRDDGLGPALAASVAPQAPPHAVVDSNYQLSVEDAEAVARHEAVLFVDAAPAGPEPFWVKRIGPADKGASFSTHSVDPRSLLTLARDLFDGEPAAFVMGIRGYEYNEFGEGLSPAAQANLAAAAEYVLAAWRSGAYTEVRPEGWDLAQASNASSEEAP